MMSLDDLRLFVKDSAILPALKRYTFDEKLSLAGRQAIRGVHEFLEAKPLDYFGEFLEQLLSSLTTEVYKEVNRALEDALPKTSNEALVLCLYQREIESDSGYLLLDMDNAESNDMTNVNSENDDDRQDVEFDGTANGNEIHEAEAESNDIQSQATQPLVLPGFCTGPLVNLNRISGYFPGSRWNANSYFSLNINGKQHAPELNADARAASEPRALQREAAAPRQPWTRIEHTALERGVSLVAAQLEVPANNETELKEWGDREWKAVRARGGSNLSRRTFNDCMCRWLSTISTDGGRIEHIRRDISENLKYQTGKWAEQDDSRLIASVEKLGRSRWRCVSLLIGTRSAASCRSRYENRLAPELMRGPWTANEDDILARAVIEQGKNWSVIAKLLPGRNDAACRERYSTAKFSSSANSTYRRWSWHEDALLIVSVRTPHKDWSSIAGNFVGRSPLQCQRRWRRMREYRKLLLRQRGVVSPSRKAWTKDGWYPRKYATVEMKNQYVERAAGPVVIPPPPRPPSPLDQPPLPPMEASSTSVVVPIDLRIQVETGMKRINDEVVVNAETHAKRQKGN